VSAKKQFKHLFIHEEFILCTTDIDINKILFFG
jgi:hypothetical protein